MRSSLTIRALQAVVVLPVVLLLTACGPEFRTPIRWGGGQLVGATSEEASRDSMSVELRESGIGFAEKVPRGVAEESQFGGTCVRDTSDRYTGQISWHAVGDYDIEIEFEDSKFTLSNGPGKFGSQSWDEIRFAQCGERFVFWQLGIQCGYAGPTFEKLGIPACSSRSSPPRSRAQNSDNDLGVDAGRADDPDDRAVAFGYELYEKYPSGLLQDQFYKEIADAKLVE